MRIVPLGTDHGVGATLEAVRCLKLGEVVVIPTDTVYGLAADALNEKAVEKVFAIKMRAPDQALPVFVSDFDMLDKVAVANHELKDYISACGSITAVLPARGWVPLLLRGGKLSIGVRVSTHPFVERLIKAFGGPITGTSANISGRGPHYKIRDVIDEFEGGVEPDIIIDAGDLPQNPVSAVIDFTKKPPMLLRTGILPKEVLMQLLGEER
ncbi:MAG: threonylcarbamoyl-AMP synthase [Candidatus Ryanbacteria bacterium RIFCSPHIGHO2_02_FULL_45_13b]|uniref:L-threonylcarbamoyladenylate synthase n=1 Tax=Candidatus Ryanbacteria bacterium RIFCSPHIGHO2_02_FULL_45_13b TaxID=1802117 RepID=A0A1G2G7L2_9BACT|nr:MAG: threonylcarbamoyl-AMP synthase [Candidatus Ryanbacteria bacterium RIFCSPHIGHO2_02_FULL_45_13b]